jgi:hypothetical protein
MRPTGGHFTKRSHLIGPQENVGLHDRFFFLRHDAKYITAAQSFAISS